MRDEGGHVLGPQPAIPQVRLRVYVDGARLVAHGRDRARRWLQPRLTMAETAQVRGLVAKAGLAAGTRLRNADEQRQDWHRHRHRREHRSREAISVVEYGDTVAGGASFDAFLIQAQRDARASLRLPSQRPGGVRLWSRRRRQLCRWRGAGGLVWLRLLGRRQRLRLGTSRHRGRAIMGRGRLGVARCSVAALGARRGPGQLVG